MATKIFVAGPQEGHRHTHTVIFLHGKGSNCDESASELFESEASGEGNRTLPALFPTIRWVFPSAPVSHSARFDCEESQWFDTWSVENPEERVEMQREGLRKSIGIVLDVLKQEVELLPREKIFLAGISQGFATVVSAFLVSGLPKVAGLIGLSSWMPEGAVKDMRLDNARADTEGGYESAIPILLGHSADDNVVPIENGRMLRDRLTENNNVSVEWHQYEDGGHWINEPQGVDDIVRFLCEHMKLNASPRG